MTWGFTKNVLSKMCLYYKKSFSLIQYFILEIMQFKMHHFCKIFFCILKIQPLHNLLQLKDDYVRGFVKKVLFKFTTPNMNAFNWSIVVCTMSYREIFLFLILWFLCQLPNESRRQLWHVPAHYSLRFYKYRLREKINR